MCSEKVIGHGRRDARTMRRTACSSWGAHDDRRGVSAAMGSKVSGESVGFAAPLLPVFLDGLTESHASSHSCRRGSSGRCTSWWSVGVRRDERGRGAPSVACPWCSICGHADVLGFGAHSVQCPSITRGGRPTLPCPTLLLSDPTPYSWLMYAAAAALFHASSCSSRPHAVALYGHQPMNI